MGTARPLAPAARALEAHLTHPSNRTGTAGIRLYLLALGIIAAAVITLFGGAAFTLLTSNKASTDAFLARSAIERKDPELPTPVGNNAALIRADAVPPGSVPTNIRVPFQAQNPPRSDAEDAQAKTDLAPVPDLQEAKPAIPKDTPASNNTDQPADERPAEEKPATTRVLLAGALGAASVSSGSTAQVVPTSDEERDGLFGGFQIEYLLDQAKINSNQTMPEQPHNTHSYDGPTRANAVFRYRVKRECGPIGDPALRRHCIASFSTHYR